MAIAFVTLAIACAVYGAVIFSVGSGTWFFMFWFVLAALFAGVAWAFHSGWFSSLPVLARRGLVGAACLVVLCFVATMIPVARHFNDAGEAGLDCIIVLGAQVKEDGPSVILRKRLDAAYDYLARNPQTRCIVTGGQGANEPVTEASAMADYLVACGIDQSRIVCEERAENTKQNIAYSMEFLDPENDTVGIVTNNFHVFRGLRMARAGGIRHACGIAADSLPLFLPNNLARESLSIAKAFVEREL